MSKYRIKIVNRGSSVNYIPQVRKFGFWMGIDCDGEWSFEDSNYFSETIAFVVIDKYKEMYSNKKTVTYKYIE